MVSPSLTHNIVPVIVTYCNNNNNNDTLYIYIYIYKLNDSNDHENKSNLSLIDVSMDNNAKYGDREVFSRLMTLSPMYPCGKLCSTGTHNETVKT